MRSPVSWLPTLGGVALIAIGGGTGALAWFGLAGIAVGVGWAAWRLTVGRERLNAATLRQLRDESHNRQLAMIRQLQQQLRSDKDARTGEAIRKLREIYKRMYEGDLLPTSGGPAWQFDVRQRMADVYESSLASLRRTFELWQAAVEMDTEEMRNKILGSRDEAVREVVETIAQLGVAVDSVQAKSLDKQLPDEELSMLRGQLDRSLEVARRVEERMNAIETAATKRIRE